MKAIAKNAKQLAKQVSNADRRDSSLELLADMAKHAEKAKTLDPKKTADVPAEKRGQFLADYRKAADGLLDAIRKIEAAVRDGKHEEAAALLRELNGIKREGHEAFSSEED
jgi:soluble cytochrome b562